MSYCELKSLNSEFLEGLADRIVSEGHTRALVEILSAHGESKEIASSLCSQGRVPEIFEALRGHLWEKMMAEREALAREGGKDTAPPAASDARQSDRAVRPLDPFAARAAIVQGGDLDMVVRVSAADLKDAWECFSEFLEPSIYEQDGWTDEDLRAVCGAFWALTGTMPAMSYDWAMWLVRTQCPGSIRDVMERQLDLVSRNDEHRQELLDRVRQLDTMLKHREWWAPSPGQIAA